MNIVLVSCYDRGCLGNRILSSFLKKAGHSVYLIYLKEHQNRLKTAQDMENSVIMHEGVDSFGADTIFSYGKPITKLEIGLLIKLLKDLEPSLIGFSLRSISIDLIKEYMYTIKQELKVPIIWGGIGPTLEPERCLQYADIVCLGEGEYPLLELAEKIEQGKDITTANNLWVKKENQIVKNRVRPLIQNLDDLPFPDYIADNKFTIENGHLIKDDKRIGNMDDGFYEIMTSRGCSFACSYCCNDFYRRLYDGQKYVRRRSVDNVLKELEEAKKNIALHTIYFKDDIFTYDLKWIQEFCLKYPKRIGIRFWCYTHPLYVKKDNLELLKKAGMFFITMGVESGSENVLFNVFDRKTPPKTILQAAWTLKALNFKEGARYDLIVNNPFESDQDCRNTLQLLCDMPKPLDIGLSKLSFFPGYKISQKLKENTMLGCKNPKRYQFWNYLYLLTQYRYFPKWLIIKLSCIKFLQRHPWLIKQLLLPKRAEYLYERAKTKANSFISLRARKNIKQIINIIQKNP